MLDTNKYTTIAYLKPSSSGYQYLTKVVRDGASEPVLRTELQLIKQAGGHTTSITALVNIYYHFLNIYFSVKTYTPERFG